MNTAEELVEKIWNYMKLNQSLEKADVIIGMGSYDIQTAERAAELYLAGYAPYILFTGDGRNIAEGRPVREAELFAKVAQEKGVPIGSILIEPNATNTGENISFSRELLKKKGISVKKILVVHKPFMERRILAALKKQWPDIEVIVTSQVVNCKDYTVPYLTRDQVIGSIVGDLERMTQYVEQGFQIPQEIPKEVIIAGKKLREMGYNRRKL